MTCNKFKILAKEGEEDHGTRLIGVSIVRELPHEFCGKNKNHQEEYAHVSRQVAVWTIFRQSAIR